MKSGASKEKNNKTLFISGQFTGREEETNEQTNKNVVKINSGD